jgi:glutathione S-transferase
MDAPTALRLYRFPLSGHSHRAELYLSMLGLPAEIVTVALGKGEHKTPEFLAKNPFGQVPVLEDGELTLSDSVAILVYLSERYDAELRYWPTEPARRARVQRWFSVAAGELQNGPGSARRVRVFNAQLDHALAVQKSHALLAIIEAELEKSSFLVDDSATLADVAMYSYVAHAPEGDVSLDAYPRIRAWLGRVEALPGFIPFTPAPAKS